MSIINNEKDYLKNLYQGCEDPTQYEQTKEDLLIQRNEDIIVLLDTLTKEHFGEYASDFFEFDPQDLEDCSQIWEDLNDNQFFHEEIIYYSKAIKYLQENDSSLSESIELANEYGYTLENINSELLASLHASRKKEDEFWQYIAPELDKLFNN